MKYFDVIIVGGGASGVSAAINIKKQNHDLNVLILEQNDKILKKVLKTGNGKCNLGNTNLDISHYYHGELFEEYIKEFNAIDFFKSLGLLTKIDNVGRIYPYSETATSVINILLKALDDLDVLVKTDYNVNKIIKKDNYIINNEYEAKYLVLATGSNSQAITNGYELAKSLSHNITPLKGVLTPIKLTEETKSLQGLKVKCELKAKGFDRLGEILFKEDGISGILALEASRYVNDGDIIYLDFAPDKEENDLLEFVNAGSVEDRLNGILPKMLAKKIIDKKDYSLIKNYPFKVKGLYDTKYSQVTRGGVNITEIKNTLESKVNSNLYFGGEILDIDGDCGGYNLYLAWLSGYIIGKEINR